jgi:hypothetical protein
MKYPVKNTEHIIEEYLKLSGFGYSCKSWRESETIGYLSQNKLLGNSHTLISNEPAAVYILTNFKTKSSPAKTFYNSPQLFDINLNTENGRLNKGRVYLIWFEKANRNFLYSIDELQKKLDMAEVAHFNDGAIYTFMK